MVTDVDERSGLVKTHWADIRKRVLKVEPKLAKLIDELSPDKSFPLYLAYYPYGALTGDTTSPFIPQPGGEFVRLSDPCAPKDVIKHLGYGKDSVPMGVVLEKELEYFIDLKDEKITIPWVIYSPGTVFPFARVLNKTCNRIYAPNGLLSSTSGARSAFMLPNIGCATNHINLQRDFNIQSAPPKSLYEHWKIFKEIIHSNVFQCDWKSCLLFFSSKWVDSLHNDKGWLELKMYLHELAWHHFEYRRNHIYYDIAFAIIQKQRNLKPNPYLADTACHLFTTALGAAPGYAPAINENALPLDLLQKVFVESYGLKKYLPTILTPVKFDFETDSSPVYYSLQNPATHVSSPKSREVSSTLFEMRELQHITKIFAEELAKDQGMCSGTVISKLAREVKFKYFHNKPDRHNIVRPSTEIAKSDERFSYINPKNKVQGAKFASDAPFVRGCISILPNS